MEVKIADKKGPVIPREFIGFFIEDINYAVDGGLYAEMLENRNFESMDVYGGRGNDYYAKYDGLYGWDARSGKEDIRMEIVEGSPVNERNPHYLRVTGSKEGTGFVNKAYDGIFMRPGISCHVSFYARCVQYKGTLGIALVKDGKSLLETRVEMRNADKYGWNRWEKYEADMVPDEEIRGAGFAVILEEKGVIEFDCFSMIPEDAVYGIFRKDLAQTLKELHPGFLRFPGGCVVEGATLANRYRFRETLGTVEGRRYNWNRWALHENSEKNDYHSKYSHYGQTNGVGFYEYFLLCEYLGAKPLPVLGVGLACQYQSHEKVELEDPEIYEYIQEYLDLIEFANGGGDTKWGAVRVQMGHEKPFGLEMVGVGNEQWENEESRFFERYTLFEKEIHKVYPDIKLIGTAGPELDSPKFEAAWEFYNGKEGFVYAVDEHYYTKPDWFVGHTDYFDHVSRKTKVFFGEYAAHPESREPDSALGRNNLEGALAEAAFLTGMARNSDVVVMTCYAPLLARAGYVQWTPDLIWFDEKEVCKTPNYYVQQMFAENLGDYNIALEKTDIPCQISYGEEKKELIVKLVNTSSEARDIEFVFGGNWKITDGCITETVLAGEKLCDYNNIGQERLKPQARRCKLENRRYRMMPFSFSVLRIPAENGM